MRAPQSHIRQALRRTPTIAAAGLLSLAALPPCTALAQDSVGSAAGLAGNDSPSVYQASADSRQVLRYVVDLAPRTGSWGGKYALGPVLKASKSTSSGYFDLLVASQSASNRFASGPFFSAGPFALWSTPGQGVNAPANAAPASTITGASRVGQQMGLAFLEFGAGPDSTFGTGDDENSIIGAVINFQFRRPDRLFVSRIAALQNKASAAALGTASFGLGSIDELGNTHVYADAQGMTSSARLTQRDLLRSRIGTRDQTKLGNVFQSGASPATGDSGALDVVRKDTTSMTVPAIIPPTVAGGLSRPVALATDLGGSFVYESAANSTTATAAYLPVGSGPRGSLAFIPQAFAPVNTSGLDVGAAATLARTDASTRTRAVQIIGITGAGAPDGAYTLTLPVIAASIIDPADGFSPGAAFSPVSNHEFTNYASQASFRGGSSQVAMTVLPGGDLLVSALVAATGGGSAVPQSQDNYLAVARIPAAGGNASWVVAAHTGNAAGAAGGLSKAILGRTGSGPLVTIGRLARYTEVQGSAGTGPSISSPAMDRAGNLYFMAAVSLDGTNGPTLTTALLRANRDPATGAYALELLATLGDVLPGLNSGRNYQIQFMGVADADSVDSGTIFSGNIVQDAVAGASPASAAYGSPASLGALVFRAKIVYDIDNDSIYADPSGAGSGSNSPDQAYNVVMLLMPRFSKGDFNRDQMTSVQDIFDFLARWFTQGQYSDYNGDGATTVQDIFDFLADWFGSGS